MPWNEVFINLAYVIFLVALVVKDMLSLRILMTVASVSFIAYALVIDSVSMQIWNCLFTTINLVQIVRLLLDRRNIELSPELQEIYTDSFINMSKRDFLNFWYFGREDSFVDRQVCREGKIPENLMYLIDGKASVVRGGSPVVNLGKQNFVAEMSYLTNEPASANVTLSGQARLRVWSRERLDALEKMKPDLIQKLRISISRDLSHKLRATAG